MPRVERAVVRKCMTLRRDSSFAQRSEKSLRIADAGNCMYARTAESGKFPPLAGTDIDRWSGVEPGIRDERPMRP